MLSPRRRSEQNLTALDLSHVAAGRGLHYACPNHALGEGLAYETFSRCSVGSHRVRADVRTDSAVRVFDPPGAGGKRVHSIHR